MSLVVHGAPGERERGRPLLTICTPTFERPELLRRALESVVSQADSRSSVVELVVADNSTSEEPEEIARSLLARWAGPTTYVRNRPSVGMVDNHNRCLELASGRHIAFLHDDDVAVPGSIRAILDAVSATDARPVHLFGVEVVRMDGTIRHHQRPRRDAQLSPRQALWRLVSDSSFVRLPGIVTSAEAYRDAGPFDREAGNAIDLDMWVRLFARHGLHTVPHTIAAYTVHEGAMTSGMFTAENVDLLLGIFERAAALGVLTPREVRRGEARWFSKFILAGAYRSLEAGDRAGAAEVLRLFQMPEIRRLGPSVRWLPVRAGFSVATVGARRRNVADREAAQDP